VLFGFATDDERRMFTLLLSVSGVGLKIARTLVRVADEGKKQKLMEERDELSARLTLSKCLNRGSH
jgi:Holliday junction resolvasome RuvABC DNA-binding subunit